MADVRTATLPGPDNAGLSPLLADAREYPGGINVYHGLSLDSQSRDITHLESNLVVAQRAIENVEAAIAKLPEAQVLAVDLRQALDHMVEENFLVDAYDLIELLEGELLPALNGTAVGRRAGLSLTAPPLNSGNNSHLLTLPAPE